jgi:hypothetical protein
MGNGASTRPAASDAVPGSATSSEECHVVSIDAQHNSDGESSTSADLVNLDYSHGSPVPSSCGSGRPDTITHERKSALSSGAAAVAAAGSHTADEAALNAAAQSDHDEHDDDAQEASSTYNAGDMSVESIDNSPRDVNSMSSNNAETAELTPRVESLVAPMLALSPSPPHSLRTGGDFDLHEASFDSHCGLGAAAQLHPQPFDSSGSDAVSDSRSSVREQQQQQPHWPARGRRLLRQPQSAAAGATAAATGSTVFIEPAIIEERATDLNDTGSSSIAASITAAAASVTSVSPPPISEAGCAALELRNLALERQVAQLKNQLAGQMESLSFSLDTAAAAAHSSSMNSSTNTSTSQRGRDRSNSRSKGKASGALARVNSRFNSSLSGERGGSRGRSSPPRNSSTAAKAQQHSSNGIYTRSNSPPPPLPALQKPPSHQGPVSQLERNSSSNSCIAQARRVNTSPTNSSSLGRATAAATAAGVGSSSANSGVSVPMLRAVQGLQKKPRGNRSCAVIAPLDSSSSSGLHSSSAIDVTAGRKGAHSALPSSSSSSNAARARAAAGSNGTASSNAAATAAGGHSDAKNGSLTSRSRGRRGGGDAPAHSLWDSADNIASFSNGRNATGKATTGAAGGATASTAAATQRSAAHATSNSSSSSIAKRGDSADYLQDSSESLTGPVSGTKHTRRGGKRRETTAATATSAAIGHGGSIDSLSQPRAAAASSTVTPAKQPLQLSHPDAHSTVAAGAAAAAVATPANRSSAAHHHNSSNNSSSFSTGENIWAESLATVGTAVGTSGGESQSTAEDAFFGNGSFDSERGWGSQLSSRWAEVEFMLRHAVETDADLTYTAGAAEAGLIFMDHLEAKAQQLGVRKGQLSRWLLPYDLETSVAEQRARTPGTARFAMPQDIAAQISDREVRELTCRLYLLNLL